MQNTNIIVFSDKKVKVKDKQNVIFGKRAKDKRNGKLRAIRH
jgi:hypothetical protein